MPETLSPPSPTDEALRQEVERLRLLHSISLEFSASLDFDELLPRVFQRVLAALGGEGGSLWIAEGDMLRCRVAEGGASQKLVGALVPIGTGFVGDVAQRQKTTIVTRAVEDPRYEPRIDSSEMLATTVMATAMVAGGVTVGAIQVSNKLTGKGVFDAGDRELLEGLATSAAAALRNAQLHTAEKRARDLALVLEISREITATLDLDRVLRSVVNLASRALTFDRGAVGIYEKGQCEIRAVAGQEKVDPKDPGLKDLIARASWAAGRGEQLYLTDRTAPASDAERLFVTIFGQDLETDGVESGIYLPLKDEEGVLGVLVFEAGTREFASSTQIELAAILANQTAVALRNAQLYHEVPLVDALGALAAKKRAFLALPRRKLRLYAGVALLIAAALTLIRWPLQGDRLQCHVPPGSVDAGQGTGRRRGRADAGERRCPGLPRNPVGLTPCDPAHDRPGCHRWNAGGSGARSLPGCQPRRPGGRTTPSNPHRIPATGAGIAGRGSGPHDGSRPGGRGRPHPPRQRTGRRVRR